MNLKQNSDLSRTQISILHHPKIGSCRAAGVHSRLWSPKCWLLEVHVLTVSLWPKNDGLSVEKYARSTNQYNLHSRLPVAREMELDHDLENENAFLSKSSNYRVMKFDFHACSPMSAANSFVFGLFWNNQFGCQEWTWKMVYSSRFTRRVLVLLRETASHTRVLRMIFLYEFFVWICVCL